MNVPVLDIVLIVVFIVIVVRVVIKGFIKEFLSMAALIFAVAGSVFLSGPLSLLIGSIFGKSGWNQIIAFLVCFLVIYLVIKLLETKIRDLFDKLNLENLDRSLGFFLGLVEGFLVVSLMLLFLNWLTWIKILNIRSLLNGSYIAQFLLPVIIPFANSLGVSSGHGFIRFLIRNV